MNSEQVSEYLTRVIQPRFATLRRRRRGRDPRRQRVLHAGLDRSERLAARGVTASDVVAAIRASEFPRGARARPRTSLRLRDRDADDVPDAGDFRRHCRFAPTAIRSCGCATWPTWSSGRRAPTPSVSFNGKEGTFIGITPTPAANPLSVASEVTKAVDQIQADTAARA